MSEAKYVSVKKKIILPDSNIHVGYWCMFLLVVMLAHKCSLNSLIS